MQIVTGPRQSGRTQALIDWVREDPDKRYIITSHWRQFEGRYDPDYLMGLPDHFPHRFTRANILIANHLGIAGKFAFDAQFAIDNLEDVLHTMLRQPIHIATMQSPMVSTVEHFRSTFTRSAATS